jgi:hypothetical protein
VKLSPALSGPLQGKDSHWRKLRKSCDLVRMGSPRNISSPIGWTKEIERCLAKRQQAQSGAKAGAVPAHDWDDPDFSILEDRRGDLPDFPLDVLSEDWQTWATNAAHGAGTTVDHVLVPLLAVASSLIGTARRVKPSQSWSEPFTMWTAIVGFSGTGKTPGLDVTKRALTKIEQDRRTRIGELRRAHESKAEQARAAFKRWKAAVQEAVEKGKPSPLMPPDADVQPDFVEPRLHVSNSTVEKIRRVVEGAASGNANDCRRTRWVVSQSREIFRR